MSSINGLNFLSNMTPLSSTGSNMPVTANNGTIKNLTNTSSNPASAFTSAGLNGNNPMQALVQIFSMLLAMLNQMSGSGSGSASQAYQQPSSPAGDYSQAAETPQQQGGGTCKKGNAQHEAPPAQQPSYQPPAPQPAPEKQPAYQAPEKQPAYQSPEEKPAQAYASETADETPVYGGNGDNGAAAMNGSTATAIRNHTDKGDNNTFNMTNNFNIYCDKPPAAAEEAYPPQPEQAAEDCPPPPAEEKPPTPPPAYNDNGDSQYYGDPHFVGFGGEKYDVMGEDGKTYNILSDKGLQYNAEFAKWGAGGDNATVIDKAGITSGKDQLKYELKGDGPLLNGKAMEKDHEYSLDNNGKATWSGSELKFSNAEYNINLKQDPANKDAILSDVKIAKGANPLGDGVNPHGLLGQTADGVAGEHKGVNNTNDKKQGGSVIDGSHTDYVVNGLFDTNFEKFNQFSA